MSFVDKSPRESFEFHILTLTDLNVAYDRGIVVMIRYNRLKAHYLASIKY